MIISHHYLALMINVSQDFLKSSPEIKKHLHTIRNKSYTSYYFTDSKTHKRREYSTDTPKGRELARIYELRRTAQRKLNQYTQMWNDCYNYPAPKLDLPNLRKTKARTTFITKEIYDSLIPRANPMEIDKPHPYNGTIFRSKSEREFAEYLDTIGIEYKYEPLMRFNNTDVYPDFVCFIPELGIGFIIEHFGMMDSPRYLERAKRAITGYLNQGLLPGIDILLTYERENTPPRTNYFESQINRILDSLCAP